MMEAVISSETSVNIYQTTRYNIPEDNHLHIVAARTWNLTISFNIYYSPGQRGDRVLDLFIGFRRSALKHFGEPVMILRNNWILTFDWINVTQLSLLGILDLTNLWSQGSYYQISLYLTQLECFEAVNLDTFSLFFVILSSVHHL
jgi:hypothetical protein